MEQAQPIYNPTTHYRIEVRGRVDRDWLQSFNSSVEISVGRNSRLEDITVLEVYTDQSGTIGLLRRLHGMGVTIQQFQMIPDSGSL